MKTTKRLTARDLGIDPKTAPRGVSLGRMLGRATGCAAGTSQFGPWVALTGVFEVYRQDGEQVRAFSCILPDKAINEEIAAQVREKQSAVTFAFDVTLADSKRAALGYTWVLVPAMEATAGDPLADLKKTLPPLLTADAGTAPEGKKGRK